MSKDSTRRLKLLRFGDDDRVSLRFGGNGSVITARALETRFNGKGHLSYLLLDRLILRIAQTPTRMPA